MCRVLRISRSGFYAWCGRPMSARARQDLWLTGKIEAIHRRSRGVYGSPNIHAELADDHGIRSPCSKRRSLTAFDLDSQRVRMN
jgi:putative transposase